MKSPNVRFVCGASVALALALTVAWASADDAQGLPQVRERVKNLELEFRKAEQANDDKRAEELAREILQSPMDPADEDTFNSPANSALKWLHAHDKLRAWLAGAEKELEAAPDAKHLVGYLALGWPVQLGYDLAGETIELGKAPSAVWLRIRRVGSIWTLGTSPDGEKWTEKDVVAWVSRESCQWGFASTDLPIQGAEVPAAFSRVTLETTTPHAEQARWTFEPVPVVGKGLLPKEGFAATMERRMDAMVDCGWRLHRTVTGDATLTARLELPASSRQAALRVALGSGPYAPRVLLSVDADGMVRCSIRHHDSRGAMAALRLAQLCPKSPKIQVRAAKAMSSLGLRAETLGVLNRLSEHDFVAHVDVWDCDMLAICFEDGKREDLVRWFREWKPTPEEVEEELIPSGAYAELARLLAEAGQWNDCLVIAHHCIEMAREDDYYIRALAGHVVKSLEGIDQQPMIPFVVVATLFGEKVHELVESGSDRLQPPHWCNDAGTYGDDGPWCPAMDMLYAAEKHGCGAEIYAYVRGILHDRSIDDPRALELDRMDLVLAGIAAHDTHAVAVWRDLVFSEEGVTETEDSGMPEEHFFIAAATMFERWKGHDREALETWIAATYMDQPHPKPRTDDQWDRDLFMAEGAVRCALKLGDVATARRMIALLNERFAKGVDGILEETRFAEPGVRILQDTLEQKQPELTRLFLPTMNAIVSQANHRWARDDREGVLEVKKRLENGERNP